MFICIILRKYSLHILIGCIALERGHLCPCFVRPQCLRGARRRRVGVADGYLSIRQHVRPSFEGKRLTMAAMRSFKSFDCSRS
jgi:hypothetical protein